MYGKIENTSSQIINKKEVILFNKTLKIMIKKTITLTVSVEITTLYSIKNISLHHQHHSIKKLKDIILIK